MTDISSSNFMSSRYPIEVIRSDRRVKTVSARIVEGVIRVRIPSWMTLRDEAEYVSNIVDRIERQRRSYGIDLAGRARVLAEKFDLPLPTSIRWSKTQRQRWGSCSPHSGHIRISNRLVDVPPWVLDHVIVHELAHPCGSQPLPGLRRVGAAQPSDGTGSRIPDGPERSS